MQSSSAAPQRHLPIRKDWLAATQEKALEPDRPIIDPHHHLWDRPGNRYLLHDLVEDTSSGHNIRATVFLECREMYRADGPPETRSLGETTFVAGVAAMSESGKYGSTQHCAGIIGNVDLRAVGGRAKGILEQHVVASGGRFRGIRNGATWHSDPSLRVFTSGSGEGLYLDRSFREGFAALAALNLTFEAWAFHSQLGDIVSLAAAFPETKIVVNHVGGSLAVGPYAGKSEEVFKEWRGQIQKLGQFPNVYMKLGGLGMPSLMGFELGQQELRAVLRAARQGLGTVSPRLYRGVRPRQVDVRKQLPGRQGDVQLFQPVERVQARLRGLLERREERDVPQHRAEVLSVVLAFDRHSGAPQSGEPGTHAHQPMGVSTVIA